jgi:hypothetical protein
MQKEACPECHARPGYHKLACARIQRSMVAVARRLKETESREARKEAQSA